MTNNDTGKTGNPDDYPVSCQMCEFVGRNPMVLMTHVLEEHHSPDCGCHQ